ncbi:MAG TPA: twin transmembrane helix small protein [Hyphomicrobiaceae bacterium]|nr:twin transmembrane helix small protein [Hyphomicrobiaceae bacterium]
MDYLLPDPVNEPTPRNKTAIAMDGPPRYIALALLAAVTLVLLAGLWNMMRGTNPSLSQSLMRWRVGLQFLAIVIMLMLVYLFRS